MAAASPLRERGDRRAEALDIGLVDRCSAGERVAQRGFEVGVVLHRRASASKAAAGGRWRHGSGT